MARPCSDLGRASFPALGDATGGSSKPTGCEWQPMSGVDPWSLEVFFFRYDFIPLNCNILESIDLSLRFWLERHLRYWRCLSGTVHDGQRWCHCCCALCNPMIQGLQKTFSLDFLRKVCGRPAQNQRHQALVSL